MYRENMPSDPVESSNETLKIGFDSRGSPIYEESPLVLLGSDSLRYIPAGELVRIDAHDKALVCEPEKLQELLEDMVEVVPNLQENNKIDLTAILSKDATYWENARDLINSMRWYEK